MEGSKDMRIFVTKNGPYVVTGGIPLSKQIIETNELGESWEWREGEVFEAGEVYKLCRCGHSATKPFCDNTHAVIGFDGTETAERAPYLDQAEVYQGPKLILTDAEPLCAFARFCDARGQVWNLVKEARPAARELAEREASYCPSGRLVAWRRSSGGGEGEGEAVEPRFEPSIGLVEDPHEGVSGPIWVRGGITIESSGGFVYERRNRVTLCRCGASESKPFCDGSHASIGFTDEAGGSSQSNPSSGRSD